MTAFPLPTELHRGLEPHRLRWSTAPQVGDRHVQHNTTTSGVCGCRGLIASSHAARAPSPITATQRKSSTLVPGHRHPKSRRDGGAGMAGTEMIKRAFAALEIARDTALLPEGVEPPKRPVINQWVGLVAHVLNHTILVQVKGLIAPGSSTTPRPGPRWPPLVDTTSRRLIDATSSSSAVLRPAH